MTIKERLKRLERALISVYPSNIDGFITALGVNEKDFETPRGYDFLAALNATAKEDWKDFSF